MKKLFFFVVLVLLIYNITGCTKQSSEPTPVPSFYRADDATSGIFNYIGFVNDSVLVIDSVSPPTASGFPYYYTSYKKYAHKVSGQIRIKRVASDTTIFHLTRPINDGFDTVSNYSGIIFQTDTSYFVNFFQSPYYDSDTIIKASYLNNSMNIPAYAKSPLDINWNFIELTSGDGKFVNGKWEINYQTKGVFTERIASLPPPSNPMPFHFRFNGFHSYHLTLVKKQ